MRLIGSLTEQKLKEMMIASHKALFETNKYSRLQHVLKTTFPNMKTAYFIGHVIEQGEDIYTLLVNTDSIVGVVLKLFCPFIPAKKE